MFLPASRSKRLAKRQTKGYCEDSEPATAWWSLRGQAWWSRIGAVKPVQQRVAAAADKSIDGPPIELRPLADDRVIVAAGIEMNLLNVLKPWTTLPRIERWSGQQ